MPLKHKFKKLFKIVLFAFTIFALALLLLQTYFYEYTESQIYYDINNVPQSDYVLIFACGIVNNKPTPMLRKRLEAGLNLIQNNKADKIILSGYKDGDYYDEVNVMKTYLTEHGISEDIIVEDKFGDNTYYSIKNIEKLEDDSIILLTQKWHLIRAIYLANKLDVKNVSGFVAESCGYESYTFYMNFREAFARVKAVMDAYGIHIE